MPNTYRNPRYMIDHAYQSENATITSPAADPPISRVVDGQNQRVAEISQTTLAEVDIDRGTGSTNPNQVPIDRIIIAGHNSLTSRNLIEIFYSTDDITYIERPVIDGATIGIAGGSGPLDFKVVRKPGVTEKAQFERVTFGAGSENHQVGEIYASRILTTSSGLVQSWEDLEAPNSVVAETFAHNVYSLERGDARRVWTMKYEGIDDLDMQILDEVRRTVGLQVHAFWFDPPASGKVSDNTLWDVGDFANWVNSASITLTELPNGSQSGGPAIRAINTLTSGVQFSYEPPGFPFDLSGKLFQFDMKQSPAAWVPSATRIRMRLVSTNSPFPRTEFSLGDLWVNMDATNEDEWQRFIIDIDTAPVSANNEIDIQSVQQIGFFFDNLVADDGVEIANTTLIEKSEQVAFVELLDFRKRQVSDSPKFRLAWDVDVVVREVLS